MEETNCKISILRVHYMMQCTRGGTEIGWLHQLGDSIVINLVVGLASAWGWWGVSLIHICLIFLNVFSFLFLPFLVMLDSTRCSSRLLNRLQTCVYFLFVLKFRLQSATFLSSLRLCYLFILL